MFMGHIGIALAAKGLRWKLSLLVLCILATAPDLIDFSVGAFGQRDGLGLWTHSLPAMFSYAIVVAVLSYVITRDSISTFVFTAVAASHVLVDIITSSMPLWPGGRKLGLHLYIHPFADLALEATVILLGWLLYIRHLPANRRISAPSLTMILLLLAMQGLMATMNVS